VARSKGSYSVLLLQHAVLPFRPPWTRKKKKEGGEGRGGPNRGSFLAETTHLWILLKFAPLASSVKGGEGKKKATTTTPPWSSPGSLEGSCTWNEKKEKKRSPYIFPFTGWPTSSPRLLVHEKERKKRNRKKKENSVASLTRLLPSLQLLRRLRSFRGKKKRGGRGERRGYLTLLGLSLFLGKSEIRKKRREGGKERGGGLRIAASDSDLQLPFNIRKKGKKEKREAGGAGRANRARLFAPLDEAAISQQRKSKKERGGGGVEQRVARAARAARVFRRKKKRRGKRNSRLQGEGAC